MRGTFIEFNGEEIEYDVNGRYYTINFYAYVDYSNVSYTEDNRGLLWYETGNKTLEDLSYTVVEVDEDGNPIGEEDNPEWCRGYMESTVLKMADDRFLKECA